MIEASVIVFLKTGVLDVQGKAIEGGLGALGFKGVTNVRVGRILTFTLDQDDRALAQTQVETMCERVLANGVIESYRVELA